ncbi:MAG: pectin acetylesterase-family hydrolase [Proteobacteria bacterium]|nr:pectin acetylesterase-family hydrolase [Pseudomonadota bacterium]
MPIVSSRVLVLIAQVSLAIFLGSGAAHAEIAHSTLFSGWEEYQPGGETSCARGDPFSFFVYPGDPERVVFDFMGGGSCADGAGCDLGSTRFLDRVEPARFAVLFGIPGVNDLRNLDNPYVGWTRVFIPYCTGDLHWGHIDKTYQSPRGYKYQIRHRGAVNVQAVMDWSKKNLSAAKRVFVSGCSAGGYASVFYTPLVQESFPGAELDQFADSSVAVPVPGKPGINIYGWNMEAAAPSWIPDLDPKQVDFSTLNMNDFYIRAARHYPNIHFSQATNHADTVQMDFYPSPNKDEWRPGMFAMLDSIGSAVPNFSSFVSVGTVHCNTWNNDFYHVSSNHVMLRDWLSGAASRRRFSDVSCKAQGCDR